MLVEGFFVFYLYLKQSKSFFYFKGFMRYPRDSLFEVGLEENKDYNFMQMGIFNVDFYLKQPMTVVCEFGNELMDYYQI